MKELRKSLKALSHNEYGDFAPTTVCTFYLLLTIDYLLIKNKSKKIILKSP
ncbi:hypothetical protein cce_0982 [Crocosphaera subtropica ATCC 51142]|uniref:Uncharacterized protein n=1 Tax=Crocosphaera subtropica (strain ATCC 51142 / BH68) TaxID=43989 RepID=B1WT03_CROS5|nr:hypothetical protein cce_0982 [Crocosphaera subtropica ATCC 51142]